MSWNKKEFFNFIIDNKVVGFFNNPIKLKSGRLSYWYVNWRKVAEDVYHIDKLSDYIINFIKYLDLTPDCFFGVPEGATKLGIIIQYKWARMQENYNSGSYQLAMGRAKPKEHGDPNDKYFLGIPKGKIIVIEDVTTTGGSLINAINQLKEFEAEVIAAIGLTNRNELREDKKSIKDIMNEMNIKYIPMSNAVELLPILYNILKPGKEIAKNIESYYEKYGTDKIKLI